MHKIWWECTSSNFPGSVLECLDAVASLPAT